MHKIFSFAALMGLLIPGWVRAETPKSPPQFAVSIPDIYYEHPVHLLHPYLDYWLMKGPLLEKIVKRLSEKNAPAQLSPCASSHNAAAVLVLQPHLFYNPQSRIFYAEIVANVYTKLGESAFTTKQEVQQIGDLAITPDYTIEKAYTQAVSQVMAAVNNDQTLTTGLNGHVLNNAETICKSLGAMSGSKTYY